MSQELLITLSSALLAFLSFAVITYPFLSRQDRRRETLGTIAKRRTDLYNQARADYAAGQARADYAAGQARADYAAGKRVRDVSIAQLAAKSFRVRKILGQAGDDLRVRLAQAGYRSPTAPLTYVVIRLVLPLILIMCAMAVLSAAETEFENTRILMIFALCGVSGFFLPRVIVKNQMLKRQQEINENFPDALDMILVCVQGGIGIEASITRIADEIIDQSAILGEELGLLSAELGLLNDRRKAFHDFADRVGSGTARTFGNAMVEAEKYGTSISKALRVMADELRDSRMGEAERKAAALPPKLTVPMILFFLPALFIVILGPAGIEAFATTRGG